MKKVFILLNVVLLISIQMLSAQNIYLVGKITDSSTNKPISNVNIKLKKSNYSTTSNNLGNFDIKLNNISEEVLILSHVGYKKKEFKLNHYNTTDTIHIKLSALTLKLSEVEIMGQTDDRLPYSIAKISLKKIEESNLSDIGNIIAREPNIGGIKKGATGIDPVIRGFKYSQVVVQLNGGTRIEGGCPNRMDPTASHVNINDLSNITIYKGPFALKYGANFGGLVNLETFSPQFYSSFQNNISVFIGAQTNHTGYKSGIRIDGGDSSISYSISLNKNKFGNYIAGNGDIINSSSDNYNINAGLGFKVTNGHVIKLSADKSWGRNVDFTALPMDERKDDTEIYEASYTGTNFNNSINLIKASLYHSNVNHEMDNKNRPFSDTVVAISKIHAMNTGGRLAINLNIFNGNIELGGNFEHIYKDGKRYKWLIMQPNLPSFNENIWSNAQINNLGINAEYQQLGDIFSWIVAARTDFNTATSNPMLRLKPNGASVYENTDTESSYLNFSFSGGSSWQLNESNKISISFGKGTRSPDMIERYIILLPVGYDPYDYLGNPQLKPETNHELDFSYNFNNDRFGSLSTSIFFSYVTQYISTVLVPPSQVKPQTKGVLGVKTFINIDEAYLTGFEIAYNTPQKNRWLIQFNSAYTMGINPSATAYIIENGDIIGEENVKNDPLPEIPPFESNLWFSYSFFNKKLIPEINIRMVAAQNLVSVAYNEDTTPGFTILNFKINYTYNSQLQINFGVNNLLNINYYEHLNRRIIGTNSPFLEPGRLFYTNLIIKL